MIVIVSITLSKALMTRFWRESQGCGIIVTDVFCTLVFWQ